MARYFFHVFNGQADVDLVGTEFDTFDAVRLEAIKSAGAMLSAGDQTWAGDAWQMMVAEAGGSIVFSVRFSIDRHGL